MMVVAQFWAFANDLYSLEQGKRLFPLIGVGGSIGAATGSFLEAHVVGLLGLDNLLLLAAALLATTAGLVELIHRRSLRRSSSGPNPEPPGPAARRETNGLKMVANRRYLRIMALFTIVFTFANTNGEYILSVLISDAAAGAAARGELGGLSPEAYISQRYGQFYFVVNALGILLQALVVSRVVRAGGIRLALLLTPVIALGVWSAASILPVLGVVWLGKALENSTDYSINNTARQMLWLPLPSHVKYNAKQAIDALFVRLGDVASALLVFVAVGLLAASIRSMAIVNASLVVAWLATAGLLVRHYRRMLTKDVATKIERGRFDSLSHAVSEP
jgi:AAA family ATP:ADP antiporter